jgi:ribose-phosphate pyrophosphokinase
MKLISGSSNKALGNSIAKKLGIDQLNADISEFSNGERRIWIKDAVRGQSVVLVQSFSDPCDQHIMEFLLLTDALERLGARHINVIIPWLGYSLQDKVFRQGEPIAAKVVANLVSNSYIKRAFFMDLHNTSTPGFFSIPTSHLSAINVFVKYARDNIDMSKIVVASPDFGGLKKARVFADILKTDLVNIDKKRDLKTGKVVAVGMSGGTVKDKTVIIFDDCIVSGGTVMETARLLKEEGATAVHFFATHGLFTGDSQQKLAKSAVDTIVITNSIHHDKLEPKITSLDVGQVFADELKDWQNGFH